MLADFTHRFVPGRDPSGPVLLALHGTGGDENDLIPLARLIGPQAAILSPRGRVLEHGMPRFFRRIAEGVFDLESLRVETMALAEFVSAAAAHYQFEAARVFAVGYSNGANIAASLMLLCPEVLAGGVLLRPMLPFEPESPPDLRGRRVLMSAGRRDPLVPAALTERLAAVLEGAGATVTLAWHETGHHLTPREMEQAARWFVAGREPA